MKQIPLTQGKVALVDDDVYEDLMKFKWYANKYGSATHPLWYAVRNHARQNDKQKSIKMHRVIWEYFNAIPDGYEIDHINHDGLDNRMENLRIATHRENMHNQVRNPATKTSQYKGIYWDKSHGKWKAQIKTNGNTKSLGYFVDEVEAARAYNRAAIYYFGQFACLNVLPEIVALAMKDPIAVETTA